MIICIFEPKLFYFMFTEKYSDRLEIDLLASEINSLDAEIGKLWQQRTSAILKKPFLLRLWEVKKIDKSIDEIFRKVGSLRQRRIDLLRKIDN
jgi:hypothetical protein